MSGCEQNIAWLIRIASAAVVVILDLRVSPGLVAAISSRGDIELALSVMWSMIGPLLAVNDRLPGMRAARGPFKPAMSAL